MAAVQITLYIIIAFLVFKIVKKMVLARSIKHYSPGELSGEYKNNRNILILDVRNKDERNTRLIKGSIHIPLAQLKARAGELMKFKEKEIVCYCRSGNRSLTAAALLKKEGFKVANLKGGIVQWNLAGLK